MKVSMQQSKHVYFGIVLVVAGAAFVTLSCNGRRSGFREQPPPSPLVSEAGVVAPECEASLRCSGDLKRVLRRHCDGTEEVITECGPDLGCGGGACVDPCKSVELSKGSIGCAFATLPPDTSHVEKLQGACYVAMIVNVWDRPVTVRAELGDEPIDISSSIYYAETKGNIIDYTRVDGAIAPGKVGLVFLAQAPAVSVPCPSGVVPALREDPIDHKTTRTRAFRLTTDTPVSAFAIWPYGGAFAAETTATLLLPTSSWDKNYIAVSAPAEPRGNVSWPVIQIVASEDDTEVRMRPNVNLLGGGGVLGAGQGQTQTWTLARNEVLQITQPTDTSGSPIEANKPIGLFGGSECTFLRGKWCDPTQQQIPPISQWGSAYALVPHRPRTDWGLGTTTARERVPWRIIGAANGTKLTYDPARPVGAPETLEAGQVETFVSTQLLTVRSQDAEHSFYAGMFMTGSDNARMGQGDPDFVNVVPSDQFLDRYIFFADHTYPDTTLTLVRRKTVTGFQPVTLECAGEIADWKPLGNGGEYEFAWLYLTNEGVPQTFAGGTCGYGRHEARSDGPFAVYVWGVGYAVSYGYAGGQGSRPLNSVKGPRVN